MKKVIISTLLLTAVIVSCNTPTQKLENAGEKVEKAEDRVIKADENLTKAKEAYLVDIENYKVAMMNKITANDTKVDTLLKKEKSKERSTQAKYDMAINKLKVKNMEIKNKLNAYTAEGAEKWSEFKFKFDTEIDSVEKALNNLVMPKK